MADAARAGGLKALSLALLAVQNVASALLVQASRAWPEHRRYAPSSVVLVGEAVKLAVSLAALLLGGESPRRVWETLAAVRASDSLKVAVPAVIYTVQNNLVFLALANIPSAVFQVFSQLKVLTTAVFSVLLLGRRLARVQWVALVVLVCGVALAQLSQNGCDEAGAAAAAAAAGDGRNPALGVAAVCLLAVLSGFAGVYQERIVKRTMSAPLSYFNVQLCFWSIFTNAASVYVQSRRGGAAPPLLHGFTWMTWLIVLTQASGGLLVSLVIKLASNLAKSYVCAVAIFATGIISHYVLDFDLNATFMIGAVLVTCSVVLYNEPAAAAAAVVVTAAGPAKSPPRKSVELATVPPAAPRPDGAALTQRHHIV